MPDRKGIVGHEPFLEDLEVSFPRFLGFGKVVGEIGPYKAFTANPGYLDGRLVHVRDLAVGTYGDEGVKARFDEAAGVLGCVAKLFLGFFLLGNVSAHEEVPYGPTGCIVTPRYYNAGRKTGAVLAHALKLSFGKPFFVSRLHQPVDSPCHNVFGHMEYCRVLSQYFFLRVAIVQPRPLIPGKDLSVQVLPDNGILRRTLKNVVQKVFRLLELGHHTPGFRHVPRRCENTKDIAFRVAVDRGIIKDIGEPPVPVPDRKGIVGHEPFLEDLEVSFPRFLGFGKVVGEIGPYKAFTANPGYLDGRLVHVRDLAVGTYGDEGVKARFDEAAGVLGSFQFCCHDFPHGS
ncbi:MAG: hypothetical protein A4E57_03358 [Syntrophorhabdaceae bacterium PtaU1.Bin034]|nr:MAG: hypothetical protein A4E57_03358 [Syntrophorhabdaceae bacterium PtaU1.Bin034]